MTKTLRLGLAACGALWLMVASGAWAMMTNDSASNDPDFNAAADDVAAHKYADAIPLLEKVVARDPKNADAWNGLGLANRQLKKYPEALGFYEKALAINPDHLGANEYLGELYLVTGDLPKAKERLEKLNKLCPQGCNEYRDLKAAIDKKGS